MNAYWFLYKSDGSIVQSCIEGDSRQWSNLPSGIASITFPITDTTAQSCYAAAGYGYAVQNNLLVSTLTDQDKLKQAQVNKIIELRQGYTTTLSSGFQVTLGQSTYTLGWSTDDKANLMATQDSINDGLLSFPINYSDINGHPIPLSSQSDLDTIKRTASSFFANQHQQILSLVGQTQSSTTVNSVNTIVWTPVSY
jgi:hypothetical protein